MLSLINLHKYAFMNAARASIGVWNAEEEKIGERRENPQQKKIEKEREK